VVKPDLVSSKVVRATDWLDHAAKLISVPPEQLAEDAERRDLASFYIFLSIQECIDLAAHWVADAGWGSPEDAASTFDVLADRRVIDRDLAERLRGAVGLRNRIAHGYASVDHSKVQEQFQEGAETLRRFLALVSSEAGL
jgi:uncharacterized protein YutE (UPF0331/DUF86 family)